VIGVCRLGFEVWGLGVGLGMGRQRWCVQEHEQRSKGFRHPETATGNPLTNQPVARKPAILLASPTLDHFIEPKS